jgi:hypothetical protein
MLREKNDPIDVKLTNLIRQFSTRNFGKSCRFLCKKNIICRILLLSAPGEQNIYPLPLKRQMVDPNLMVIYLAIIKSALEVNILNPLRVNIYV